MRFLMYCTVLYCTVLYCTVLYCTVLYCTVLYCTVQFIQFYPIQFPSNILYSVHFILLHCTKYTLFLLSCRNSFWLLPVCWSITRKKLSSCHPGECSHAAGLCDMPVQLLLSHVRRRHWRASCLHGGGSEIYVTVVTIWRSRLVDADTDIAQRTPYQGFSVTGYIVNR
jgi:hypothetical protein